MKKFTTIVIILFSFTFAFGQNDTIQETGNDKKFFIKPVGFVNLNAIWDFNGLNDYDDFTTSEIPLNPTPYEERQRFHMTARQTRFGASMTYVTPKGPISAFVTGDFYTGNTGTQSYFRLRQAYLSFGHWTFGQHSTTFGDPNVCPVTVDFEGPNSSTTLRNPMILYQNNFKNNDSWKYSFAIEMRGTDYTNFTDTMGLIISQPFNSTPNLVANISKGGKWGFVTLSGMINVLRYFNMEQNERDDLGYGAALSVVANTRNKNHFSLFAFGGLGVANYINDLSGSGYNAVPDYPEDKLDMLYSVGGFLAYTQNWNEQLSSNIITSYLWLEETDLLSATDFRYSYYGLVNLFYVPWEHVSIGAEYVVGELHSQDQQKGDAHRLQFLVQLNF